MDDKPLIGISILAIVVLILASLTNVVGYQSVKSTVVNDSPLFKTRTQKATNQQLNVLTAQYLGMEKGNLLQFQMSENKNESFVKTIEYIGKMDDKTFEWFTKLCIQKARRDNAYSETNNEIIQMLQLLRKQSKTILFSLTNRNDQVNMATYYETMCPWYLGCYITNIAVAIALVIFIAGMELSVWWCGPTVITCGS